MKIFRKDYIVGIDLGNRSFKMAQLGKREEKMTLIKIEMKEIPVVKNEAELEGVRLRTLKGMLQKIDVKRSTFLVTINSPESALRVITVPPMPKAELKEAIRYESKNYFPFSLDDFSLDFEILGEIEEQGIKKYQVAVAAIPRKTIDQTLALLKKSGVVPFSLIPVPSALHKLVASLDWKRGIIRCLADIGEQQTELVILKDRDLIFSRKIAIGGRDFTQAMTAGLISDRGRISLTLEEAEKIKRDVGIPVNADEPHLVADKISTSQIVSLLHAPLEQLVNEIDRSFDYYREETGGGKVDSLVLFGQGARLKGLSQALSQDLGMEAVLGNPLQGLKMEAQLVIPDEGFSPFAAALGAALSMGRGVNLVPAEIKEQTKRVLRRATLQSIVTSTLLILILLYVGMKIQLNNYQKRIDVAKLERSSLGAELQKVAAQSVVHQALSDEPYWEEVFKELTNAIPDNTVLTSLVMKAPKMTIKAEIFAENRESILADFIRKLESGIFKNVKLVTSHEKPDKSGSEFELECEFD